MNSRFDRTEIDMSLGPLLVEAKLTEGGFQRAPLQRLMQYEGLDEAFCVDELPRDRNMIDSYQLIRGVMGASHLGCSFVVMCDARRRDLIERWFLVMRAVRHCDLRQRLALVTWQELAAALPGTLQDFLSQKYGIFLPYRLPLTCPR